MKRVSSVPLFLLLTLVSLLFPLVLFPLYGIGDHGFLDLYLFYGPEQVRDYLSALGPAGRAAYISMLLSADLLYPVVYSLALSVALTLLWRERSSIENPRRYWTLLPFAIVLFDWCENLSIAWIARAYPDQTEAMVRVASACTSMKWSLVAFTLLLIVSLLTRALLRRMRRI